VGRLGKMGVRYRVALSLWVSNWGLLRFAWLDRDAFWPLIKSHQLVVDVAKQECLEIPESEWARTDPSSVAHSIPPVHDRMNMRFLRRVRTTFGPRGCPVAAWQSTTWA
jgi:hypothetical protein